MELDITYKRSNFAQFSDALWLRASVGGTTIDFDIEDSEKKEFAYMMADLAFDALNSKKDTSEDLEAAIDAARELIERIDQI